MAQSEIIKKNDDLQQVFGWANVSVKKDGSIPLDLQGDEIGIDVLEKAAYEFVLDFRTTKENHKVEKARGRLIESMVFTKEKMAAIGIPQDVIEKGLLPEAWWVGFQIDDSATYQKVRDGIYKMFSIEGRGKRTVIEDE